MQRDPIGLSGGDGNLYAYAFNDPLNLIDPSGRAIPLALVGAGAVVGGVIGGGVYALASGEDFTIRGFVGAVVSGAVAGGVGVVAAPLAGSLGLGTGVAGGAVVNAGAGVASATISAAIDPNQDLTVGYAASSAAFGALGGYVGGKIGPTVGMATFRQVGFPRTLKGVLPRRLGGKAGSNAINAIYKGGGVSVGVGIAGPFYVQGSEDR